MPKIHWKLAPERVRRRVDLARLQHGQLAGMQAAYTAGFDWPPEDVQTPAHDRLREIEATGDRVMIVQARASMSVELAEENRCIVKASSMRKWASLDSAEEVAAAAKAERDSAGKEVAIAARTREIIASQSMKIEAAARSKAVREIEEAS